MFGIQICISAVLVLALTTKFLGLSLTVCNLGLHCQSLILMITGLRKCVMAQELLMLTGLGMVTKKV